MKKSELQQIIREEIGKTLKEEAAKEVILSNEILDFLEYQDVISKNDAQKVHKALTAFLKEKLNEL
jgi:hypothetical protein